MEMRDIAIDIAKVLSEKKAQDITVIDISTKSSFADYFVNATAGSERQLAALIDFVQGTAEKHGLEQKSVEGRQGSGWMLVDYGDIIVNIFTAETRERYALDKVWGDCETIFIEN